MNTKAIRECAASHVYWTERANETPSALIRWTIPGLCDRVDELEERLRAVEALTDSWTEGVRVDVSMGTPKADVEPLERLIGHIRAALAPATSPAEQEGDRCPECGVLNDGEHDPADAFGPAPDWNHPDRCPQCHMFPTGGYRAVQAKRAEQEGHNWTDEDLARLGQRLRDAAEPAPKDPPDTSWVTEVPGS